MVLPKIEDWKAPWEVDLKEGDDPKEKLDLDKLKRFVHGVLGDKERIQETAATTKSELDKLEAEKVAAARKDESDVDRLTRERDEAIKKAEKAGETSIETLKLRVAIKKGLNEAQTKRLVGTTQEELEADADELLESWGPAKTDDEPDDSLLDKAPRRRPRSLGDPEGGAGSVNVEEAADAFIAGRSVL